MGEINMLLLNSIEFQKGTFYNAKHCLTCTNITSVTGRLCCIATSSCSISPRHGDGVLSAFHLKEDLVRVSNNQLPKHGLSEILKGNEDFFPLGKKPF